MTPLTTPHARPAQPRTAQGPGYADPEATTVLPPHQRAAYGAGQRWPYPVPRRGGPQAPVGAQPPIYWAPRSPGPAELHQRNDRRRWLLGAAGAVVAVTAIVGLLAVATSGTQSDTHTAESATGVPVPPLPTKAPRTATSTPANPGDTVADTELPALLPDTATLNRIMGTDALAVMPELTGTRMYTDTSDPAQCLGLVVSGARDVYSTAPWRATANQTLKDPSGSASPHLVFNAVTTFSTAQAATDFVAAQLPLWQSCQASPITLNPHDEKPLTWITNDVAMHGQSLTASAQPRNSAVSCQRALTAVQNIVIDVQACSVGATDQAEAITAAISGQIHP